jgi:hypothetical protein
MVAAQARPAYIYDTTLGDWVPMSGVVDTGQAYTFTANQTFSGLVNANNGINAATTLSLQTGGVSRLSIDSSGRVIAPYQPAFQAYNPSGTFLTGVAVAIFNATYVNVGNHYSTSTGRFTAPIAGIYKFTFDGLFDSITTHHIHIAKNGVQTDGSEAFTSGDNQSLSKSMIFSLAAGDYVNVSIDNAGSRLHQRYGSFTGFLVG